MTGENNIVRFTTNLNISILMYYCFCQPLSGTFPKNIFVNYTGPKHLKIIFVY